MASISKNTSEITCLLQSLAELAILGVEPDAKRLFGADARWAALPNIDGRRVNIGSNCKKAWHFRKGKFAHPFLKQRKQFISEDGLAVYEARIDTQKFPYLRDHQVDGEIIFPATGYLQLAWAVAQEQMNHQEFFLEDLHFDAPLIFKQKSQYPPNIRLEICSEEGEFKSIAKMGHPMLHGKNTHQALLTAFMTAF